MITKWCPRSHYAARAGCSDSGMTEVAGSMPIIGGVRGILRYDWFVNCGQKKWHIFVVLNKYLNVVFFKDSLI